MITHHMYNSCLLVRSFVCLFVCLTVWTHARPPVRARSTHILSARRLVAFGTVVRPDIGGAAMDAAPAAASPPRGALLPHAPLGGPGGVDAALSSGVLEYRTGVSADGTTRGVALGDVVAGVNYVSTVGMVRRPQRALSPPRFISGAGSPRASCGG